MALMRASSNGTRDIRSPNNHDGRTGSIGVYILEVIVIGTHSRKVQSTYTYIYGNGTALARPASHFKGC